LCEEVIKDYDFVVLCGYRSEEEQNKAFKDGFSKLKFPKSKHNTYLSKAVDLAPYKNGIDWNDIESFKQLGARMKEVALKKNIKIAWGGDWKMRDYPHFQIED
jgi:peptidoglycan L-alanyl-D-glutamate endopeptidase CwlK